MQMPVDKTPSQGASSILFATLSPDLKGRSAKLWSYWCGEIDFGCSRQVAGLRCGLQVSRSAELCYGTRQL